MENELENVFPTEEYYLLPLKQTPPPLREIDFTDLFSFVKPVHLKSFVNLFSKVSEKILGL